MEAWIPVFVAGLALLLHLGAPSSALDVNLTSDSSENNFCNGSEVIFTCETRGSGTLEWRCNSFYVRERIAFAAALHLINSTRTSSSNADTVATLTHNYMEGGVRVLVSTLRIIALLNASDGTVFCSHANGFDESLDFQVVAPPAVPQNVVTQFQLEHVQNMCAIASVLRSPTTNPAEAAVTNYTVSVDGESVPYSIMESVATDGMRHTTLLYNSSCSAHNISISANSMCGHGPSTDEIMLKRFMPTVPSPGGARNIECSVTAVVVCVVLVAFKHLLDLP